MEHVTGRKGEGVPRPPPWRQQDTAKKNHRQVLTRANGVFFFFLILVTALVTGNSKLSDFKRARKMKDEKKNRGIRNPRQQRAADKKLPPDRCRSGQRESKQDNPS